MLEGIKRLAALMKLSRKTGTTGFTLVELLTLVLSMVLAGCALVYLKALTRPRVPYWRLQCSNNLKQDVIGFKTWALDHNDKYPMQIAVTNGGAMDSTGYSPLWKIYQVMSNEISNPKLLVCPEDNRVAATNWEADITNAKISYFVGLTADDDKPETILSGDRNLTNGTPIQNGILTVRLNRPAGWTHAIHTNQGNFVFADGSVRQLNSSQLWLVLSNSAATNRLAMP